MRSLRTHSSAPIQRRGFTLVELLIVISIIAILMALILPAINGVRRNARLAQVKAEMTRLESAIAAFKGAYGVEPPSHVVIYPPSAGGTNWNVDPTSRAAIRRIWPQFSFATSGGASITSNLSLSGAECLAFFLGGMVVVDPPGSPPRMIGFSKNPVAPFTVPASTATTLGNRTDPFYEFDVARLVDVDGDSAFEYLDTLPNQETPYLYLSSNEGKGYTKLNFAGVSDDYDVFGSARDMTRVYSTDDTTPTIAPSTPVPAKSPWRPQSFQIISPGEDFEYGFGGYWADGVDLSTQLRDSSKPVSASNALRAEEADNITNFAGGTTLGG